MSIPRALLLVLALLQAAGIVDAARRASCEQECKRDGCDGDCTPGNDSPQCPCHCPSSPSVAAPGTVAMTVAPIARPIEVSFDFADQVHSSPDPREILHVPRLRAV